MPKKIFGIDFGTSMFKIYKKDTGIVLDEKTMIAVAVYQGRPAVPSPQDNKKEVVAGGCRAYDMFEKAPANIRVSYPVKNGVIADIENMQLLFNYFLKQLTLKKGSDETVQSGSMGKITGADYYIAVPADVTEVEKRAFYDMVISSAAKAKKISLIDKPIAAALGLGLDITSSRGVMVVDIGADTTELSILSLGGIVLSKLIPVGGRKLDESIRMFVKKNYKLIIGDKTAEMIKMDLANAVNDTEETTIAYGRNVVTGLPAEIEVSSSMVLEAIKEHLFTIVDSIRVILERTPPEISSDIMKNGIYVTGGSAKIKNIAQMIFEETHLKVNISEDCENSVIKGLGVLIDDSNYAALAAKLRISDYDMRK